MRRSSCEKLEKDAEENEADAAGCDDELVGVVTTIFEDSFEDFHFLSSRSRAVKAPARIGAKRFWKSIRRSASCSVSA